MQKYTELTVRVFDEFFLIPHEDGTASYIEDPANVGAALRTAANGADKKPVKKRGAPRGPRGPRKALGKGIEAEKDAKVTAE